MPQDLIVGGSGNGKKPSWIRSTRLKHSWNTHFIHGHKINCGIFALFYGFYPAKNRQRDLTRIKQDAYVFQKHYGFGETMVARDFEAIIQMPQYRNKRIVIMQQGIADCSDTSFTGSEFGGTGAP